MPITDAGSAQTGSYPSTTPTGRCAATGTLIAPGEAYIATLVREVGVPGLRRLDFSADAWAAGVTLPSAEVFASWRARGGQRDQRPDPVLGDEQLAAMFLDTEETGDPRHLRFRYLLALLLIRRRIYRVVGTHKAEGAAVLHLVRRGEGGGETTPIRVVDPGLDESSLEEMLEQVGAVLAGQA
jgi:hypothetical protein